MRTRPTSGSRREGDLVDVELVDVGHLVELEAAVLDPELPTDDAPALPHRSHRRRLVGAGAAALLVTGVVVANVVELREERAREAALAALPGILPSLAEPLVPLWEQEGWWAGQTDDVALVQGGDGTFSGLDPASGAVLWTRGADEGEWCWTLGSGEDPLDAGRLTCLSATGGGAGTGADPPVVLTVLDAATGAEVDALTLEGQYVALEPVDGDVVLVVARADGHLRAVRWRPATDEVLWDVTSEEPVVGEGARDLLGWGRDDDVFTLSAVSGDVAFALDTGAEVPAGDVPSTAWVDTVELADGGTARWEHRDRDDGEGAVLEPDGSVRFHLPGPLRMPQLDDGSVPDVLVAGEVTGSTIWGLDARTGEDRWTLEALGSWPLLVLDGRMLLAGGTNLIMIDLRSGTELWTVESPSEYWQTPITDGELVLLLEREARRPVLVARSLADGSEVWRVPVPQTTYGAVPSGSGQVVLHTESAVVGLG